MVKIKGFIHSVIRWYHRMNISKFIMSDDNNLPLPKYAYDSA